MQIDVVIEFMLSVELGALNTRPWRKKCEKERGSVSKMLPATIATKAARIAPGGLHLCACATFGTFSAVLNMGM